MAELIAPFAAETPERPALVDEGGVTSFAALDKQVNRLVNALRSLGLGVGDVGAAICANTREYFEIMLAAAHSGILVVPVNWHWVADELAYVLDNAGVKVLFADARFADVAVAGAATRPELVARIAVGGPIEGFEDYESVLAAASDAEPADQVVGGPMFYTSGTTGRPKGVRSALTQSAIPTSIFAMIAGGFSTSMGVPPKGVSLLDGPLYHSAQWAFSMFPLMAGSTVVMRHRFDPAETLRTIDEHQVTNLHLVPTQFIRLLKLPAEVRHSFDGSSLQVCWHGAAPCPQQTKRDMIAWWGPKIVEYYGATEASIVSLATSEQWLAKPGTLGPIQPTCEVTIVGEDGRVLGPGESGTIYIRNLMGMSFEYHKDPDKTAGVMREGGSFTVGDVGYLDADGWLFMSDRKIDMIISGGVNIYPAEIEGVLVEHPMVRDAAVFGVPDEEFGEAVKAAVELVDGAEDSDELRAEIIAFCRTKLAGYKAPRSIDVEAALPRHPTGKLYKRLLRDRYWEGQGRSI